MNGIKKAHHISCERNTLKLHRQEKNIMIKKIATALLTVCLLVGIETGTAHAAVPNVDMIQGVHAPRVTRTGAADLSSAIPISLGTTLNGNITESTKEQVYKFTLSKSGRVTMDMTSYMEYYTILIYDNSGELVWYTDYNKWNVNLKYRQDLQEVDLINGTYYLRVTGYQYWNNNYGGSTGTYRLNTKFTDAGESYKEYNNDFNQSQVIIPNSTIKGQIASNDPCDIYKFSLDKTGRVNLDMTSYMKYNSIMIYDSAGSQLWYTDYNTWNENLKYRQDIYNIDLAKGTYYLRVTGYQYRNDNYGSTGTYTLKIAFMDARENIAEPNNDFSTACPLNFNSRIYGQIALNDRYDIFKFSLQNPIDVKLSITSYMRYYSVSIYNNAGERLWCTDYNTWNENVGYRSDIHKISLTAGSYYMKVTGYQNRNDSGESTGSYNFSLGTFAPIANATVAPIKDVTYTGGYRQPVITVKYNGNTLRNGTDYKLNYKDNYSIGKATVIITGIGNYSGEKQVTFKIVPKKVSLRSVKNTAKRTITVKWQVDNSVSGYEIYRSTRKKTGYKKIYTVKGAYYDGMRNWKLKKKKTYYYKVRAYKVVDGKKYYGAFSKVKFAKVKK